MFGGVIVEGPFAWPERPAAEFSYDGELGAQDTASVLLGAIWRAHEMISVAAGLRAARAGISRRNRSAVRVHLRARVLAATFALKPVYFKPTTGSALPAPRLLAIVDHGPQVGTVTSLLAHA